MSSTAPRAVEQTPAGTYVQDELVVALAYEPLVCRVLRGWGAEPVVSDDDRDPRLGLARVRLSARAALGRLRQDHPDWVREATSGAGRDGYPASPLDTVSRCLRSYFRGSFAGWVPEFGKNRVLSRLHGSYVIGGGGDGKAVAQPDYVIGGGGDGRAVVQPDYVIGGGGDGRAVVQPDYVIGGGGDGSVLAQPDYVIGGGGTGSPTGRVVEVPLRASSPGTGVRVAVVDTSAARHPWLDGGFVTPARELLRADGRDDSEMVAHGTFVVGMVLRQAPGATVVVREGLDENATRDSWTLARIIGELAAEHPAVVNLSLGCLTDDNNPPLVLSAAINALGPDTVVVAAAGNHGNVAPGACPAPSWPAALDAVIAVGAVDDRGAAASFSPQAPWVDAVSDGVDVVSTIAPERPDGALFASWSGTSFAAGAVSGAIAAGMRPGVSARQSWARITASAARDGDGRPVIPLNPLGRQLP